MILESNIVEDYIAGKNVDCYKDEWFYNTDGITYKRPDYKKENIEHIKFYLNKIRDGIRNFEPCNAAVWNTIFPGWKDIISKVKIKLIVGFPEPYDAVTVISPDGEINIIFDLAQWIKYGEKRNIKSTIHNFLTHELCHVCIANIKPEITSDTDNYIENLDKDTFNEGFAHLVSYNDSDIDKVEWHNKELQDVSDRAREEMKTALSITDKDEQSSYLQRAVCGRYYDKFACMCGMFYLVKCYENGGLEQLKSIFNEGCKGFAAKAGGFNMIRYAVKEDYDEVENIMQQVQAMHVGWRPDIYKNTDVVLNKSGFNDFVDKSMAIVAVESEKIVGVMLLLCRHVQSNTQVERKILFVDSMAVDKNYRGKGIGHEFFNFAKEILKNDNYDGFELQVNAKNKAAMEMYKHYGFTEKSINMELIERRGQ